MPEQGRAKPRGRPRAFADYLPQDSSLASLGAAAAICRGCDLYKDATQTAFREGPAKPRAMFADQTRQAELARFIEDLKVVAAALKDRSAPRQLAVS